MTKFLKKEEGAVFPLAGALIMALIAMAGLLVDGGMAVYQYNKLTGAVDAAAIGTLDAYDRDVWEDDGEIEIDQSQAYSLANQYLTDNMEDASISHLEVEDESITVNAEATASLFFMTIFGQEEFTIEAMASTSLDDANDEND